MRATQPVHLTIPNLISVIISTEEYILRTSSLCYFYPVSCYFLTFRSKFMKVVFIAKPTSADIFDI